MAKGATTTQTQQQQATSAPWAPAQPVLQDLLTQLGGYNTAPNAAQQGGLDTLLKSASDTPNFAPQATDVTNSLLSGGPDYSGILSQGYGSLQSALAPYASGSMVGKNT